eukprot:1417741-Rhodomonas_salina.1
MDIVAQSDLGWRWLASCPAKTLEVNKHYSPAYIGMGEAYNQLELFEVGRPQLSVCLLYTSPSPRDRG